MLAALNQARTNGRICPGDTATLSAAPLVYDATLEPAAREWAWEAAHENWGPANGCNGRTSTDRVAAAGATSAWKTFSAASPADAIEMLLDTSFACPELMKATNTKFAGAGAYDVIVSHAIMLK
jgi:cysteine-rich secretory family protein